MLTKEPHPACERVRKLRERLGLQQTEMAELGGIARTHLANVERGENHATGAKMRDALAKASGVSLDTMRDYLEGSISLEQLMRRRRKAA